eukprot:gene23805-8623_t
MSRHGAPPTAALLGAMAAAVLPGSTGQQMPADVDASDHDAMLEFNATLERRRRDLREREARVRERDARLLEMERSLRERERELDALLLRRAAEIAGDASVVDQSLPAEERQREEQRHEQQEEQEEPPPSATSVRAPTGRPPPLSGDMPPAHVDEYSDQAEQLEREARERQLRSEGTCADTAGAGRGRGGA